MITRIYADDAQTPTAEEEEEDHTTQRTRSKIRVESYRRESMTVDDEVLPLEILSFKLT